MFIIYDNANIGQMLIAYIPLHSLLLNTNLLSSESYSKYTVNPPPFDRCTVFLSQLARKGITTT